MASSPQPKELSCIRSRLSCVLTKLAAAYNLEWYIHWSITIRGRSTFPRCETLSSVNTAISYEFISSGIPWLISGSIWYGLPARTIPRLPVSFKYLMTSSPFLCMSSLDCISSFHASKTAAFISPDGISGNSSCNLLARIASFSKEIKGFLKSIFSVLSSSTLFLIFSA